MEREILGVSNVSEQLRGENLQSLCNLLDIHDVRISVTALYATDVRAVTITTIVTQTITVTPPTSTRECGMNVIR